MGGGGISEEGQDDKSLTLGVVKIAHYERESLGCAQAEVMHTLQ